MKTVMIMVIGILMFSVGSAQVVQGGLSEISGEGMNIHLDYGADGKLVKLTQNTDLNVFFQYPKGKILLTEKAVSNGKLEEYQYILELNDQGLISKGKDPEGEISLEYDDEKRLSRVTRNKQVSTLSYKNGNLDQMVFENVTVDFTYTNELNQPAIFIKDTSMQGLFSYWSLSASGYFGTLSRNLTDSITVTEEKESTGQKRVHSAKLLYKKDPKGRIVQMTFRSDEKDLKYDFKYK